MWCAVGRHETLGAVFVMILNRDRGLEVKSAITASYFQMRNHIRLLVPGEKKKKKLLAL